MRRFIYFLSGHGGAPNHAALRAAGLRHVFSSGTSVSHRVTLEHAAGGMGALVAAGSGRLEYDAAKQNWRPMKDRVWIGCEKDAADRPGPADLARKGCAGAPAVLGDGNTWLVPTLRFLNGATSLPRMLQLGADGKGRAVLSIENQRLCADAGEIFEASLNGSAANLPADLLRRVAIAALAINYCVREIEIDMLNLFDGAALQAAVDTALDGPALRQLILAFGKAGVA